MSLKGSLEAVLFSSGRGMNAQELGGAVGSPASDVEEALRTLADEYRVRDGGIGLARSPNGLWSFEIRRRYTSLVEPHLAPEIEGPELKTLSLIALAQPIEQATLVERRGQRVYAHVRTLVRDGLVERRRKGRATILTTSSTFARRFSLPFDPEEMRQKLGSPEIAASLAKPQAAEGEEPTHGDGETHDDPSAPAIETAHASAVSDAPDPAGPSGTTAAPAGHLA